MIDKLQKMRGILACLSENIRFANCTLNGNRTSEVEAASESKEDCIDDTINIILNELDKANAEMNKINEYLRGERK